MTMHSGQVIRRDLMAAYGFSRSQADFLLAYTSEDERRPSKEWKVPNSGGFITLRYHGAWLFSLEDYTGKGVSIPGKQGYTRESKSKIHPRRDSPMPPTARGRRTATAPARRSAPAPEPEPEENGQVDFQRYLDKDLTPTMQDFVTWFEDNVAALEDVPIDRLLTLGPTLYGHFQRSDFNVSQREARRAARAKPEPEPEPEPEPTPARRGRGRPAATSKAPATPAPAAAPARRGRGRPAKESAEAPY